MSYVAFPLLNIITEVLENDFTKICLDIYEYRN